MAIDEVINLMSSMADESGSLKEVEYFYWDDMTTFTVIIKLVFQQDVFFILAKGEDDSIELTKSFPQISSLAELTNTICSEMIPWKLVIGRHIRWAWIMINQQGYLDGIQLEFGNGDKKESIIVQIITIASSLKVTVVNQPTKLG